MRRPEDGIGETIAEVTTRETRVVQAENETFIEPAARRRGSTFDSSDEMPAAVGRFRIAEEIGRGGMGVVFRAFDPTLKRDVALKLLRDTGSDLQAKRLLAEARSMARLSHPNVLPVYEAGELAGRIFIAMEFVAGKTLRDLLGTHRPWRQTLGLLVEAGRGLSAAHQSGIIHRDFKPDNVLVGDEGRVRVTDFGLAQPTADDGDEREYDPDTERPVTQVGLVVGTPAYMSPEQYRGEEITTASDQFSFCVALFEALYGVRPFQGDDLGEMRRAVLRHEVTNVALGEVPVNLHAILVKGLRTEANRRHRSMARLIELLEPFVLAPDPQLSPYPGLTSFSESHAGVYVGREKEVELALSRLDKPLLGIVGPSGAGKSSFIRAGLFPALTRRDRWRLVRVRPGREPVAALTSALTPLLATSEGWSQVASDVGRILLSQFQRDGVRILLVIDQFEELFTQCRDDKWRTLFIDALSSALADSSWGRLVVTMRSDFIDHLARHPQFLERLAQNLMYLLPLTREGLERALVEPAARAGYVFEDQELVAELVGQLWSTAGALPLLQFAAAEMWNTRDRDTQILTRSSYHQMGEIGGALARHADSVIMALPTEDRAIARALLERLVTPERTRDTVPLIELRATNESTRTEAILSILVDARLVVAHSDDEGGFFELIHESLISGWPLLQGWLDESRDDVAYRGQIRAAARQWDSRGRPPGLLWGGEEAEKLATWHKRSGTRLPDRERDFVSGVLTVLAKRQRLRRVIIGGSLGALTMVIAAGAIALVTIAAAEDRANAAAARATQEAGRARAAEVQVRSQVERLEAEKREREAAERRASLASAEANMSRDQLEAALRQAKIAAESAEAAAEAARASARAEVTARRQAERLLAEKNKQLERERKRRQRIVDRDLRSK